MENRTLLSTTTTDDLSTPFSRVAVDVSFRAEAEAEEDRSKLRGQVIPGEKKLELEFEHTIPDLFGNEDLEFEFQYGFDFDGNANNGDGGFGYDGSFLFNFNDDSPFDGTFGFNYNITPDGDESYSFEYDFDWEFSYGEFGFDGEFDFNGNGNHSFDYTTPDLFDGDDLDGTFNWNLEYDPDSGEWTGSFCWEFSF